MLHGRTRERDVIARLLAGARDGSGGALLIRGEPGIGKSTLLNHAADADGMRVLRVTGVQAESELPFAGLHQLVRPVLGLLDALPDRQRAALSGAFGLGDPTADDRFLISLGLLNLLAEAATTTPVLCLVDDAQWLDGASAAALGFAARRVQAEPIALLFAARPGTTIPGVDELPLTGLDPVSAAELLTERTPAAVATPVRDRLLAATLGNPLGLAEIAAELSAEQLEGTTPLPDRLPVGAAIEQLFGDRARRLPADAQTLLLIAALHPGDELSVVLAAAVELGVDASALHAAEAADLIAIEPPVLRFRHPLVRSAIHDSATFEQRTTAHRALAAVLDTDDDRRVWLLAGAAAGPDDGVADALDEAAHRARERGAQNAASAAFARAAELTTDPADRGRRFTAAADSAWCTGDHDRAGALLDRAAPLPMTPHTRARAEHLRGSIEFGCGDLTVAHTILVSGAAPVAGSDPMRAAQMLTLAGVIAWAGGDVSGIVDVGRRLETLPPSCREAVHGARAMVGLAGFLRGDAAAVTALRDVVAQAEDTDDPRTLMIGAAGAMFAGDHLHAIRLFTAAAGVARADAAVSALPTLLAPLTTLEMLNSRFASASANATEGLRLAEETGQHNPAAHLRAVLAWIAAVQGREQDCREAADAALAQAVGRQLGPQSAIAAWALAMLDLGAGRRTEAFDRLQALIDAGPGQGHQMVGIFATADFVEAATRVDRADAAERAAARLDAWADHTGARWAKGLSARCRALLTPADELFTDALSLHAECGRPFDTARTELVYGEWLRRQRRRADARRHLRSACETFERLGAEPWAQLARAELLATGETARARTPETLTKLTPQEAQIARFVAEGATNKMIAAQLFLSPRTVDYHLHKIFTKLGLSSRHELMRLTLADQAL